MQVFIFVKWVRTKTQQQQLVRHINIMWNKEEQGPAHILQKPVGLCASSIWENERRFGK